MTSIARSSACIVIRAKRAASASPRAAPASSAVKPALPGGTCHQSREFGQHDRRGTAFGKHAEHARGTALHQPARQFLPDAFGDQCVGFALRDHSTHQLQGCRRDRKIETRGKPRHPQYAYRVFAERRPDVAQHTRLEVGDTVERVDDLAGVISGYRVDGEIAPRQVLFKRDIGRCVYRETLIAACGLAFRARERIFFMRFRMQENRKILAHRFVAEFQHFRRRGADHDVIAVRARQSEQFVTHETADRVDFHAVSAAAFATSNSGCRRLAQTPPCATPGL